MKNIIDETMILFNEKVIPPEKNRSDIYNVLFGISFLLLLQVRAINISI